MGQLILAHEGTLVHFAGDGIMIFFNDPVPLENPAAECGQAWRLRCSEHFAPLRAAWNGARLRP